jgi:hypothetical protein
MDNLRRDLIKLAYDNPGKVRDALLPILKKTAAMAPAPWERGPSSGPQMGRFMNENAARAYAKSNMLSYGFTPLGGAGGGGNWYAGTPDQLKNIGVSDIKRASQNKQASGPDPAGRNWKGSSNPTRWNWTDGSWAFTVREYEAPFGFYYKLQMMFPDGSIYQTVGQKGDKEHWFGRAADLYKKLALTSGMFDLRSTPERWSKMAHGNDEFSQAYANVDSKLLRDGFRRSNQLLSSGHVEDAHGAWEWKSGSAEIKIQLMGQDPQGKFWVFFSAAKDHRVKERFEASPKSIRGFRKAVGDAMMAATEWVAKFQTQSMNQPIIASSFLDEVIRVAYENPGKVGDALLPILKRYASTQKPLDWVDGKLKSLERQQTPDDKNIANTVKEFKSLVKKRQDFFQSKAAEYAQDAKDFEEQGLSDHAKNALEMSKNFNKSLSDWKALEGRISNQYGELVTALQLAKKLLTP